MNLVVFTKTVTTGSAALWFSGRRRYGFHQKAVWNADTNMIRLLYYQILAIATL